MRDFRAQGRKTLRSCSAFVSFALSLILLCNTIRIPPHEIVLQSRKGVAVPHLPREKLRISQNGAQAAWCDFISFTLSNLNTEMFRDRMNPRDSDQIVLLVDDRENLSHFWTIPWTLNMLGPDWTLQILTKTKCLPFYQEILKHYAIENAYVDTFEERYGYGPWVKKDFMRRVQFMLALQFWRGIRAEHILVVQDNGIPVRRWDNPEVKILFEEIFRFGYAGAPWKLEEGHEPGGNGGFSYRKRSVLEKNLIDLKVGFQNLLSNTTKLERLGVENEDYVIGKILGSVHFGVAPKHLEHKFACELLFQPKPFGVHHFAPRHSTAETTQIIQLALSEFFAVSSASEILEIDSASEHRYQWEKPWRKLRQQFPNAIMPVECRNVEKQVDTR